MSRCIGLAKNGLGTTYPNPLVGSVIVHDGNIISEGSHYKAGEPHAEVNAIIKVADKTLLSEATIYVSLEPCSHFGKTPPCADLIISEGIKKIVIGSTDPNPKVSGRGIQKLKDAGCDVVVGILQEDCDVLNKRFFTFQKKKRPFIFLKWAQSADGFLAPVNRPDENKPVWITNPFSRQWVHKMRAEEGAILVGTNTIIDDNPNLTTRYWDGESPMRIVMDQNLRIPESAAIFDGAAPTVIITEKKKENTKNIDYKAIDFNKPIAGQICDIIYRYNIQSLIVEGGAKMLQTFIDENLWDEAFVFKGGIQFYDGINAPRLKGVQVSETLIKGDSLQQFKNTVA